MRKSQESHQPYSLSTAGVCFARQIPAALLTLGIVNDDTTLTTLHEPPQSKSLRKQSSPATTTAGCAIPLTCLFGRSANGMRQTSNDTCENNQRDTITNPTLGYLLTQPHQKHGTGDQTHNRCEIEAQTRISHESMHHIRQTGCNTNGWKVPKTSVPQRVYWLILRRPDSPSFLSSARAG